MTTNSNIADLHPIHLEHVFGLTCILPTAVIALPGSGSARTRLQPRLAMVAGNTVVVSPIASLRASYQRQQQTKESEPVLSRPQSSNISSNSSSRNSVINNNSSNSNINANQSLLQGHCAAITSFVVSPDFKWLCTLDCDDEPLCIVWEAASGTPVCMIQKMHDGKGACAATFLPDSRMLVTLGAEKEGNQTISVQNWVNESLKQEFKPIFYERVVKQETGVTQSKSTEPERPYFAIEVCNNDDADQIVATLGVSGFTIWDFNSLPDDPRVGIIKPSPEMLDALFTCLKFLNSTNVVVGDANGSILFYIKNKYSVVWENDRVFTNIHASAITALQVHMTSNIIVTGANDGSVRVFDTRLQIISSFDKLSSGPISCITMVPVLSSASKAQDGSAQPGSRKKVSAGEYTPNSSKQQPGNDVIVTTARGRLIMLENIKNGSNKQATELKSSISSEVCNIVLHPLATLFYAGTSRGEVVAWNYTTRKTEHYETLRHREGATKIIQSVANFDVLVFSDSGRLHTLTEQLEYRCLPQCVANDSCAIIEAALTPREDYLACADRTHAITLLKAAPPDRAKRWFCVGRLRMHNLPIVAIWFIDVQKSDVCANSSYRGLKAQNNQDENVSEQNEAGQQTEHDVRKRCLKLHTLSEDKKICVADITASILDMCKRYSERMAQDNDEILESDVIGFLKFTTQVPIECNAVPLSAVYLPQSDEVYVTNSRFHLDRYSARALVCTSTMLLPDSMGYPARKFCVFKDANEVPHMAVASEFRVVCIFKLPYSGNPCSAYGIVAHHGKIAAVAASHDGNFLFTAGGEQNDFVIKVWRVDTKVLEMTVQLSTNELMYSRNVDLNFPIESYVKSDDNNNSISSSSKENLARDAENKVFRALMNPTGSVDVEETARNYFYYSQIRHQGEKFQGTRVLKEKVPLSQLPALLRVFGHFPSEKEMRRTVNQVALEILEKEYQTEPSITFDEWLKVAWNAQDIHQASEAKVIQAIKEIKQKSPVSLELFLKTYGEALTDEEFKATAPILDALCASPKKAEE